MLDNIQGIDPVEIFFHWNLDHIVELTNQWEIRIPVFIHMLDKNRIKIRSHHLLDLFLDNPCSKGVATAYLEDAIHPCKHLSHKFVARKQKAEPLGIISPDLAAHQAQ